MFTVYNRSKGQFQIATLEDVQDKNVDWIDCFNPTDSELRKLASTLKLPYKQIKHLLESDTRSQAYDEKGHSVFVFAVPYEEGDDLLMNPILVLLLPNNNILTIRTKSLEVVSHIVEQIQTNPESIRTQSDFVYRLIEVLIAKFERFLEKASAEAEKAEDKVMKADISDDLSALFFLRKRIVYLQRSLIPVREVIAAIHRGYIKKIPHANQSRFRFLYQEVIQLYEQADMTRETLKSVLEMRMMATSNILNITIRKLTAWASLFLVPTLIASVYGMNFETSSPWNMPELGWRYGYLFSIALMIVSVLALYWFFKKSEWI